MEFRLFGGLKTIEFLFHSSPRSGWGHSICGTIKMFQSSSRISEHSLTNTTEETYKVLSPRIGVAVPEWLTDARACKVITAISSTETAGAASKGQEMIIEEKI